MAAAVPTVVCSHNSKGAICRNLPPTLLNSGCGVRTFRPINEIDCPLIIKLLPEKRQRAQIFFDIPRYGARRLNLNDCVLLPRPRLVDEQVELRLPATLKGWVSSLVYLAIEPVGRIGRP